MDRPAVTKASQLDGKVLRLKLISCEVLVYAAHTAIIASDDYISPVFMPKDAHNRPDELRTTLQTLIDKASDERTFDAILLGYGLCGNSIAGLTARSVPLIVPRAHDCCTLFLGSQTRYKKYFSDCPSRPWSSPGYIGSAGKEFHEGVEAHVLGGGRTIEDIAALYGNENAKYVEEMLKAPDTGNPVFINDPDMDNSEFKKRAQTYAQNEKGADLDFLTGDNRLIHGLIRGAWKKNRKEYLFIPPGSRIAGVYDHEEIIRAELPRGS
ncbi:MAG: DUF1638 domain-containing protein [Spirochaetales bacterium]|nr:DUF1638 domain-containing protein [Spirochaetales bacterium]